MSKFTPKSPEQLRDLDFNELLAEYNTVKGTNYNFCDDLRNVDVWICEETTADGYGVYVLRHEDEQESISENVYYNEPSAYDVFTFLENLWTPKDERLNIYSDLDTYDLMDYMESELEENYDNYLRELEDAK